MDPKSPRQTIDVTGLASRGGVASQAVEAELTRYVEEKKINDLFINITERMLMVKPDNPVQFIIDYLREKYPDQVAHPSGGFDGPTEAEYAHGADQEDDESDDDDEDYVDDLPAFESARKVTRRRTAVSAEAGVDPSSMAAVLSERRHEKSPEDAARLQGFLEKNLLFSHLDAAQMKILIDAFHPKAFSAGDTLIRQGEEGDAFYLLDRGTAEVFVNRALADKIAVSSGARTVAEDDAVGDRVLTVREGETFGELALMYNAPRAATVKAATDLSTWTLDRVAFKAILVHTASARHERNFEFVTRIPMLSELTDQERRVIADALQPERYKAGAVIVQQGEPGHKFFIVEEGEVVVQKRLTAAHPPQKLLTLEAGRYFGEIALLTSKPRQASVTATQDSACLVLDRKTFNRVMGPLTDILQRNMDKYELVMSQQL